MDIECATGLAGLIHHRSFDSCLLPDGLIWTEGKKRSIIHVFFQGEDFSQYNLATSHKHNTGWVKRKETTFYTPLGLMVNALHQQTGMMTVPQLMSETSGGHPKELKSSICLSALPIFLSGVIKHPRIQSRSESVSHHSDMRNSLSGDSASWWRIYWL